VSPRRGERRPSSRASRRFDIVFEDDVLIVVEKSAMVLTVPTPRGETNTLADLVERYLHRPGARRRKIEVVQRLDRETSGLIVFGKDRRTGDALRAQFRDRKPLRVYFALVAGVIEEDGGTYDSRLETNRALTRYSTDDDERGQRAVTHYRVEGRGADVTLVRVRLETGRRNQIRVQFAEALHPVLGDRRYRADLALHRLWPHQRLALHAAVLGFDHPVTGQEMRFEAPLPREFGALISR